MIGGNYQGHHGKGKVCLVNNLSSSSNHPILKKVNLPIRTPASLYRNSPLPKASTPVLIGTIPNHSPEPVAWTHITPAGSRIFYTSLGHPQDFENPNFNQLLHQCNQLVPGKELIECYPACRVLPLQKLPIHPPPILYPHSPPQSLMYPGGHE